MPFNLQDYEPVEDRLARFWEKHPGGRIRTEILSSDEKTVVMLALIFRDAEDKLAAATGHAQETIGSTPVNRTSWVENCETSAIGRALANLGYAPKGARASREEMQKASRPAPEIKRVPKVATVPQQKRIVIAANKAGVDDETRHRITRMRAGVTSSKDVPPDLVDPVIQSIEWYGANKAEAEDKLHQWEVAHLPSTAAQAVREPGEEPFPTDEELKAAGQTNFDADAIPG